MLVFRDRWINPYRLRIDSFPGRLFPFDEAEKEQLVLAELQLQSAEIYCEIGSGSGNHAIELARRNPQAKIFGFEIRYKRAVRTIEKAQRQGIDNVYVLRIEGEEAGKLFAKHSIDGVYVNFPDPWDGKKKWKKNQVLGKKFLLLWRELLKPEGIISVKTDHQEYFREFLSEVKTSGFFHIVEESSDLYASPYLQGNISSEFENLFCSKGMPVYYVKLLKI